MIFKWLAGWTRTGDKKVLNRFTYLKPKHSGADVEEVPPLSFYEEGRNLLLLKNALSFKPKQKKRFPWQERAGMLDVFWTPETKNKCKELWKRGEFFQQMFKEEKEKWELKKISLLLKTQGYFTDWHFDCTDRPGFIVLEQLEGQTDCTSVHVAKRVVKPQLE